MQDLKIILYSYARKYDYSTMIKHRSIDRSNNQSRNHDDSYSTGSVNFSFLRSGLQKATRTT